MLSNLSPITSHQQPRSQGVSLKGLGKRLNGTKPVYHAALTDSRVEKQIFTKCGRFHPNLFLISLGFSKTQKGRISFFRNNLDQKKEFNSFIKILLRDTPLQRTEHRNYGCIYKSLTLLFEIIL